MTIFIARVIEDDMLNKMNCTAKVLLPVNTIPYGYWPQFAKTSSPYYGHTMPYGDTRETPY